MHQQLRFPILALIILATVLTLGNSGGVANTSGDGYTGAPSAGGGMESTCGVCHRGGPYGEPTIAVTFDAADLTAYTPGQTYSVTVAIAPGMGSPGGYGFQAQFLDGSTPILLPAGTLSDPAAGTQVTPVSNGRVYAEHSRVSDDSTFNFKWTAPAAGSGPVKMYVVGNTVNDNGGTSGDNGIGDPFIVELAEDTMSTGITRPPVLELGAFPNPTTDRVTVSTALPRGGTYTLRLFAADGRLLTEEQRNLAAGAVRFPVDLSGRPAGVYTLQLANGSSYGSLRLVRH